MNKMVMFLVPVLVIGGILGAGMAGVVDIPGVTPKKSKPKAADTEPAPDEATPADETAQAPQEPEPEPEPETAAPEQVATAPTTDPVLGEKKIAALWTEIDTAQLVKIIADWKDPELATILRRMDPSKTAELLSAIDQKRASALSREIQKQSSKL